MNVPGGRTGQRSNFAGAERVTRAGGPGSAERQHNVELTLFAIGLDAQRRRIVEPRALRRRERCSSSDEPENEDGCYNGGASGMAAVGHSTALPRHCFVGE